MEDAGRAFADKRWLAWRRQWEEATASGLQSYVASGDGRTAFYAIGYEAGGATAQGIRDRIMDDLNANHGATGANNCRPHCPLRLAVALHLHTAWVRRAVVNQQIVTRSPIEAGYHGARRNTLQKAAAILCIDIDRHKYRNPSTPHLAAFVPMAAGRWAGVRNEEINYRINSSSDSGCGTLWQSKHKNRQLCVAEKAGGAN